MNVLIVIPARGGSKGVKNKNIKPLLGKPLIEYTIDAAKESRIADRIVVSTDDEKIAEVSSGCGAEVIMRPPEYATDSAPIELALRHAVTYLENSSGYSADVVVWLQANVPIRKKGQIDSVINKLIDSGADSAITVTEATVRPEYMKKIVDGDRIIHMEMPKETRRQDYKDSLYFADGAVLAISRDVLMGTEGMTGAHVYLGSDIRAIVQEPIYAIEIDEPFDFDVVEGLLLLKEKRRPEV